MVIGLHGKMKSGKDTAYGFIQEWADANEGFSARREAFADPLKISAARALGFAGTEEECVDFCNVFKLDGAIIVPDFKGDWGEWEGWSLSGREYLQLYGTEAHREVFGTNFWVDSLLPEDFEDDGDEIVVVTDVRFPNEATRIREIGGEVWHVLRSTPGFDNSNEAHASEVPLAYELIDRIIVNNGSLDHYRDLVISLLERRIYA